MGVERHVWMKGRSLGHLFPVQMPQGTEDQLQTQPKMSPNRNPKPFDLFTIIKLSDTTFPTLPSTWTLPLYVEQKLSDVMQYSSSTVYYT